MKKNHITFISIVLILIVMIYGYNIKKTVLNKEYFGFGLVTTIMNLNKINEQNNIVIDYHEKGINSNNSLLNLINFVNSKGNYNLQINKYILNKFKLKFIDIDKNCFIYGLNLNKFSKSFEPKKTWYINNFGKSNYLIGDGCKEGQECFLFFTEKGLLKSGDEYNCD